MRTRVSVVFVVAMSAAVHSDYVAPVSGGYIYRSDNNGPPSLIQLGAAAYQQPPVFAPPLPLAQPFILEGIQAYDVAPSPLPYIAAKPIIVQDSEDDEDEDGDDDLEDDYLDKDDATHNGDELNHDYNHGHSYEKGTGSDYDEKHHNAHGEKESSGYNLKGHQIKGKFGHYGKKHDEGFYTKAEEEEKSHNNEAQEYGKHHEAGERYNGGDHGHKKHFSKGEDVTGYHKVFSKDEFKKDHDFYDVADNSGNFKKYGHENKKHGSAEGQHNEGNHYNDSFDKSGYGKAGFHSKEHVDESKEDNSEDEGQNSHYSQEEDFGNKNERVHEKEYLYDDDD